MISSDQKADKAIVKLQGVFSFLDSFFDSGLPKEHRKDLKKWRYHVIVNKRYRNKHGAARVFANYEETIQFIQTAYTCNQYKDVIASLSVTDVSALNSEKVNLPYFPKNLSHKEILNPTIAIERFFKTYSAYQYKDIFHEWLRIALSNRSAGETISVKDVVIPYENLRKLYSALWLVHQRRLKEPNTNARRCSDLNKRD